jgi:hypothetical protein
VTACLRVCARSGPFLVFSSENRASRTDSKALLQQAYSPDRRRSKGTDKKSKPNKSLHPTGHANDRAGSGP